MSGHNTPGCPSPVPPSTPPKGDGLRRRRTSRRRKSNLSVSGLAHAVRKMAAALKRQFAEEQRRNPELFRREAARLLRKGLRPDGCHAGRKRCAYIDKAYGLWRRQQAEIARGRRRRVRWLPIAFECIEGFAQLPPEGRKRRLRRLQNSIYNRARRSGKSLKRLVTRGAEAHE